MTDDASTGAFSPEALIPAEPGAMPPGAVGAARSTDPTQEGVQEVQVFSFLARGLHEGLHREFARVV